MNPRDLRILNKGEHITAEHYAAVTRSARSQIALPNGAFDGDIVIGRTKPAAPKQVIAESRVEVTGDKAAQVAAEQDDTNVIELKRLAGLK